MATCVVTLHRSMFAGQENRTTLEANQLFRLPQEVLWTILLETVVDRALQSQSDHSLSESLTNHALVCRTWSSIISDPLFRKNAKARFVALDPSRQYLSSAAFVRCHGIRDIERVILLAMIGKDIYLCRRLDEIECYDTDSYSKGRRSLAFHHVRTVTLFGEPRLLEPAVMVGCAGVRRLFVLDAPSTRQNCTISRIDPFSGHVELSWLVGQNSEALAVTGNNQLLLTMSDHLEHFDTDGHLIRMIATGLENTHILRESFLLRDNSSYLVCCQGHDHNDFLLVHVTTGNEHRSRVVYEIIGRVLGYCMDSRGCMLLFDRTRLSLLTPLTSVNAHPRDLMRNTDANWTMRLFNDWREMMLDEDRGLLFVWQHDRPICVFHVMDVTN